MGNGTRRRFLRRRAGCLAARHRSRRRFSSVLAAAALLGWAHAALSQSTLSDTTASGRIRSEALPEDYRLERIRIENDGTWLRVEIPTRAPWADWTLNGPPRIVIDLGQTVSHLPKAPGLYQVRLDRGPLVSLRTSQYRYEPLDHRVRITLEMREAVAYQARRVGDEIQILIPDTGPGNPPALLLASNGLSVAPGGADPAGRAGRGRDPLAIPTDEISVSPADRAAAAGQDVSVESVPTLEEIRRRVEEATEAVARRHAAGESSLTGRVDAASAPPAVRWSEASGVTGGTRADGSADAGRQARAGEAAPADERRTEAGAEGAILGETGTRGRSGDGARTVAKADTGDVLLPGDRVSADARERAAERLLRAAVDELTEGALEKAEPSAARCYRYYAGTPSGGQAGLLLRELLILEGRDIEADQMKGLPDGPDSAAIPVKAFRKLVHQEQARSDLIEADRLLRQWAAAYEPTAGLGDLHVGLAEALLQAGKPELARDHLERVGSGDPLEPRALLLLARIHDQAGEKAEAMELYRRVSILPSGPCRLRGLARLADLQFQGGQITEALENYERLLEDRAPSDEQAWAIYQTANCKLLLGNEGQARVRYEMVAERWPGSFWAPFARDRLEEMKWREHLSAKSAGKQNP